MTSAQIEIQLIASVVAAACAIPGVFLVLRRMAMITDAISHAILPGIVLGFFATQDISSPLLVLTAALSGVFTVFLVEWIFKTGLVKEDTAIGLVFPALFSLGVILISRNAGDIHLDTDAVLAGELAFAPFDRLTVIGVDIGPKSLHVMGGILLITTGLVWFFFKELKISTFDSQLAAALGFAPTLIHYSLMSIVSVTTVGAFDAVGAVLVVGFMIIPAAAAYLLTDKLRRMILLAVAIGISGAISGYWLAHILDASISGAMTTMLGVIFFIVFLFAPHKGYLSNRFRRRRQDVEFSLVALLIHLKNHSFENNNPIERELVHLTTELHWSRKKAVKMVDYAAQNNMVELKNDLINLTDKGTTFANEAIDFITSGKDAEIDNIKDKFLLFRG